MVGSVSTTQNPFTHKGETLYEGEIVSFSSRSCKIAIGKKAVKISHEDMARVSRCEEGLTSLIVGLFYQYTMGAKTWTTEHQN